MKIFTSNTLKIIAIVAMFLDHFAEVFLVHKTTAYIIMKILGRIVAPVMCYFIAEGYHYTSDRAKYIVRLLIFAVISHLPYNLCMGIRLSPLVATSVIWSLAMGLIALTALKSEKPDEWLRAIKNEKLRFLLVLLLKVTALGVCCLLAITANWNFVGVLWIVVFGLLRGNFKAQIAGYFAVGIVFHIIPTFMNFGFSHEGGPHWYQLAFILAIPLLVMYNGKRGRKSKVMTWAFYVFYPAHLLLLYLLDKFTPLAGLLG